MTAETIRILGVDPGSRITGYGVVDFVGGNPRFVDCGALHVEAAGEFADRLRRIFDGLRGVIAHHRPREVALEKVFMHRNAASALKLGQARGAALLAGVTLDLPVHEYMPNEVKLAVVGRGHATKAQIQHMVRVLLALPGEPQADAADALAIAICHGNVSATRRRIAAAAGARR